MAAGVWWSPHLMGLRKKNDASESSWGKIPVCCCHPWQGPCRRWRQCGVTSHSATLGSFQQQHAGPVDRPDCRPDAQGPVSPDAAPRAAGASTWTGARLAEAGTPDAGVTLNHATMSPIHEALGTQKPHTPPERKATVCSPHPLHLSEPSQSALCPDTP